MPAGQNHTLGHPDYYSDEEREFLVAVQRYKTDNRRPHPTWGEVLAIVHSLGYRKVAPPGDPPTFRLRPKKP